jgi:hypothetical protein
MTYRIGWETGIRTHTPPHVADFSGFIRIRQLFQSSTGCLISLIVPQEPRWNAIERDTKGTPNSPKKKDPLIQQDYFFAWSCSDLVCSDLRSLYLLITDTGVLVRIPNGSVRRAAQIPFLIPCSKGIFRQLIQVYEPPRRNP